jgi:hypothetical protein
MLELIVLIAIYICYVHQNRPILVKDLSIFGQTVYLKVPRRLLGETHAEETSARFHPQFYCAGCKISPTEPLSRVNALKFYIIENPHKSFINLTYKKCESFDCR